MTKETDKMPSVVALAAKIDANNAKELENSLAALLADGANELICDFSANEYVSSAGLRVFLSTLKRIDKAAGHMALVGLRPGVQEVFDMVGFSSLFTFCASVEEGVQSIQLSRAKAQLERLNESVAEGQQPAACEVYSVMNGARGKVDEKI